MNQNDCKSNLNEIKREKPKNGSKEQKSALNNIEMFYKAKDSVIKFFDECSSLASEAKHKAFQGEGVKILTPKQMPQRLPIALALVKAGNISDSLLNKIKQTV